MSQLIPHVEIHIPVKIISEANNYDGWRKKLKRKQEQHLATFAALQNALIRKTIQLPCTVKMVRIGPKKLDSDNLANSFKKIQDTIAEKLGVDDGDDAQVTWVYSQEPCGVRQYSVRVEITSNALT